MARKTNCERNGIKYYRKYATIGGERKMIYADSEKAWREKVGELEKLENLGVIDSGSTLGKAMEQWVYHVLKADPSIRPSTYSIYEGIYRNSIKGAKLLSIDLLLVKSANIQEFVGNLAENKSVNAAAEAFKILKKFFKYAEAEGMIIRNPCKNVNLPKQEPVDEIEVFSDEEISSIFAVLDGDRDRFFYVLALATGMRWGELAALRFSDMGKSLVKVNKQQITERIIKQDKPMQYEIKDTSPKTSQSVRDIPLPTFVDKEYQRHKKTRQEENLMLGRGKLKASDLVFVSPQNMRLQPGQTQKKHKLILMAADVPYKKFHTYRHTYITKLVQAGTNLVTVMKLAGHTNYATTLRYTHIESNHAQEAIKVLDNLLT